VSDDVDVVGNARLYGNNSTVVGPAALTILQSLRAQLAGFSNPY
jgi:hypothetical protein